MEQRPLRLGDIVDDYCPRERRITNHVIVAIVEGAIRQTRCSTCDAEHVYKEARQPRRRKKDVEPAAAPAAIVEAVPPALARAQEPPSPALPVPQSSQPAGDIGSDDGVSIDRQNDDISSSPPPPDDAWPAHRQLIRATLPRQEGEPPPARPIPEFTMHQRPISRRGQGGGRYGQGWRGEPNGNVNGNVHGRNGFGGPGHPQGHGRHGQGPGRRRRGKGKRPR